MKSPSRKEKLLYVIPGFGEATTDEGYRAVIKHAKAQGYSVVPVQLKWKYRTVTDWLEQFREVVQKHGENAEVLGFSIGAYVALLAARELHFKKLHLCSLSPYFKDDLPALPELAYTILGKRRMKEYEKYDFPKDINTETIFYVGDADIPLVVERVKKAYTSLAGKKKLIIVPDVGHVLEAPTYLSSIYREIKN